MGDDVDLQAGGLGMSIEDCIRLLDPDELVRLVTLLRKSIADRDATITQLRDALAAALNALENGPSSVDAQLAEWISQKQRDMQMPTWREHPIGKARLTLLDVAAALRSLISAKDPRRAASPDLVLLFVTGAQAAEKWRDAPASGEPSDYRVATQELEAAIDALRGRVGKGTVYLTDASKFPSTCPACEGRKMLNTTIPIADFIKLIRSAP